MITYTINGNEDADSLPVRLRRQRRIILLLLTGLLLSISGMCLWDMSRNKPAAAQLPAIGNGQTITKTR